MKEVDQRFQEYYVTNKYKGFCKLREKEYKLSCHTQMTFTNGKKEVFASGIFKEAALEKIFNKIDKYYSKN